MYQELKKKVPSMKGADTASVHYLMLPSAKQDLIYEDVERAVARMQSVVDIGRILRDRKTMPIKYPLPEVVVIHKDVQCLNDIRSLEKYVLEELNVKTVTLSGDKSSYGVTLRAEPDHKTLGLRLKGAFKSVMAEIKQLSDEAVTSFLDGEKLTIQGHQIFPEDLRIMYSFSGEKSKELSEKYEADSSEDILVMLDTTPDEEMLEEGIAREVINRVQKLRKAAGLKVDDCVTMYYTISPSDHNLAKIIAKFKEYIQTSSRTPIEPFKTTSKTIIKKETYELKGAKMELTVVKGFPPGYTGGSPSPSGSVPVSPWVNLCFLGNPPSYVGSNLGALLLSSKDSLKFPYLIEQVQDVFGLYNTKLELFTKADKSCKLEDLSSLDGSTIYVSRQNDASFDVEESNGFHCKFVNVDYEGKVSSLLLENPQGKQFTRMVDALKSLSRGKKNKIFSDKQLKKELSVDALHKLSGQTVYM